MKSISPHSTLQPHCEDTSLNSVSHLHQAKQPFRLYLSLLVPGL